MKQLEIWGCPARVKIELALANGSTVSVDVTDSTLPITDRFNDAAELRLTLFGRVRERILGALDDVGFRGLDR